MPRIFDSHIVVILLASVLFYMVGFLWYGFIFMDAWMAIEGIPQDGEQDNMGLTMAIGFVITVMQTIGLAGILKLAKGYSIGKGIKIAVMTWFFFALPFCCYAWIYSADPLSPNANTLLMIDASHLFFAYLVAGGVLGMMRKAPEDR
ncbi:MAG: DUF1761 domain-containing protein [Maricaulaceae bacterium]